MAPIRASTASSGVRLSVCGSICCGYAPLGIQYSSSRWFFCSVGLKLGEDGTELHGVLIGVEDTEPCGWRRLHCRMLERSSPAKASFFTSNFIKSKSLTYSNASGLVGSSGPMARSALIVSLFFSKVFTSVAKLDFCFSSLSLRMQFSGWVSERDALERWSMQSRSKCSNGRKRY